MGHRRRERLGISSYFRTLVLGGAAPHSQCYLLSLPLQAWGRNSSPLVLGSGCCTVPCGCSQPHPHLPKKSITSQRNQLSRLLFPAGPLPDILSHKHIHTHTVDHKPRTSPTPPHSSQTWYNTHVTSKVHDSSVSMTAGCMVSAWLSYQRDPVETLRDQGSHLSLHFVESGPPGPIHKVLG